MIGRGLSVSGAYTWLVYPNLTCGDQSPALKEICSYWMLDQFCHFTQNVKVWIKTR